MTTPNDAVDRIDDDTTLTTLLAQLDQLSQQAEAFNVDSTPGAALARVDGASAEDVKNAMAQRRAEAARLREEIRAKNDELQRQLRSRVSAALEQLEPLRQQVKRAEEVIWMVQLFLGRDEQVTLLRAGRPAPITTPISVRQLVLSMDEETMLHAESGGIDYTDVAEFDQWLLDDPEHLDQVLPEKRGIVAIVPRARGRHRSPWEDPISAAERNKANTQTHFLIRNGECLYRMTTDFTVGDRLFLSREEQDNFFTEVRHDPKLGSVRVPLEPGSPAWVRAEEQANARQRHFMRAALIIQGVIERTNLLRPLPPGVSVLRPESFENGQVRLIADAENALTEGREPFYDWLARLNSSLRPGVFIVGAFNSSEFRANQSPNDYRNWRLYPSSAIPPETGVPYQLEQQREDGALIIRYPRRRWHGEQPAQVRASCRIFPTDKFVIPLSLTNAADIEYYLRSRTERHAYQHMLPLLAAALRAKRAEAEQEAPFLQLLAGQIAAAHGIDQQQALAAATELAVWWKQANAFHRPLVAATGSTTEVKAIEDILAEYESRRQAAQRAKKDREPETMQRLRSEVADLMYIGRDRNGGYIAFAPQHRELDEDLVPRSGYVTEYRLGASGRGKVTRRDWVLLTHRRVSTWRALWSTDTWSTWNIDPPSGSQLTDTEFRDLVAQLVAAGREHTTIRMRPRDPDAEHRRVPVGGSRSYRRSVEPTGVPTAMTYTPGRIRGGTFTLYLRAPDAETEPELPERLLTGHWPKVSADSVNATWRRGVGGVVILDVYDRSDPQHWSYGSMYRTDPVQAPWHADMLVWSDPDEVQRLTHRAERLHEAAKSALALREQALAVRQVVAAAWEQRAESAAKARFMDDYNDEPGWPDHRRLLKGLHFPYGGNDHELFTLIQRLVEEGRHLAGRTVASAAQLLPDEIFELPDDILDLPVSTSKQ